MTITEAYREGYYDGLYDGYNSSSLEQGEEYNPPEEQEPCEDAISREALKKKLQEVRIQYKMTEVRIRNER